MHSFESCIYRRCTKQKKQPTERQQTGTYYNITITTAIKLRHRSNASKQTNNGKTAEFFSLVGPDLAGLFAGDQ